MEEVKDEVVERITGYRQLSEKYHQTHQQIEKTTHRLHFLDLVSIIPS